ncbi:hypothetical protein Ciccas_012094 [Cichlidogyrus casuarinus]|uniref:Uncharacterized protein n=1 Tax=Cichlidogyrus casuarinus TaxID=1844966 RepID=A0ABD2PPF1_9PLAT
MDPFFDAAEAQQNKIEQRSADTWKESIYIWCCDGKKYDVRKKIGLELGDLLDRQSIKNEVDLVLSKLQGAAVAQLAKIRTLVETLIKLMMVLIQKVEKSERVARVEEIIKSLNEIITDRSKIWTDTVIGQMNKAVSALEKLPKFEVQGDMFKDTANLLRADE